MLAQSTACAACGLTTAEFARLHGVTQDAVRQALSKRGSYFGAVPVRRSNGRLLWPVDTPKTTPHAPKA